MIRMITATTTVPYYRARYYDSTAGRFLTEDPMRFRAGTNFFEYGLNSPEDLSDPLGLQTICMVVGIGKPGSRPVVCWDNGKRPSQMIIIRPVAGPNKPFPSDIVAAYDNFQQCKRRTPVQISIGSQACKPKTTMDPRFSDDYGDNADPTFQITATSNEDQIARDCLGQFPLAAVDPRFNPKETLDPNSYLDAFLGTIYNLHPW